TRNTYASLAGNSGQGSLAHVLDTVRTEATGDLETALLRVDNMNLAGVRDALGDMAPGIEVAARRALADLPHAETTAILERLEDHVFHMPQIRHSPAQNAESAPDYAVWGNIAVSAGIQDADDVAPELATQTTNSFLGVEKTHGHWTTGLTTALLQHCLNSRDDDSRATITSVRAYLHTIWRQHLRDAGPYVAASLGAGRSRVTTVRDISFLDTDADAQHWARDVSLGLGAGHVFTPGAWRIHPHLKLSGVLVREDAVEEGGAQTMNLDIDSGDIASVHSTLGLRMGRTMAMDTVSIFPEAHVQWMHTLSSDLDQVHTRFDTFGPDFAIASTATRDSLRMGAGVMLSTKNLHGGMRYEYSSHDGGDIKEHALNLELRFLF
ncbi:MAG: autotransporter outer membrane beta-barrel domain-containing protein, partial [Deltaproteobacteria bacterium]|nr:autotransporter outer membrane beta-barrel domain-containing protein [Deltaproteobacteria bacterium]